MRKGVLGPNLKRFDSTDVKGLKKWGGFQGWFECSFEAYWLLVFFAGVEFHEAADVLNLLKSVD